MATLTRTWDFTTAGDRTGWAGTAVGSETFSTSGTNGLVTSLAGKNLTASENTVGVTGWRTTDTIANLFGISSGATVSQLGVLTTDSVTWLCSVFTTGVAAVAAVVRLNDTTTGDSGAVSAAKAYSSTTTAAANTFNNILSLTGGMGSNSLNITISSNLATGNSSSAVVTLGYTKLIMTVTYTPPTVTRKPCNPAININDPAFL